jgi:hypothetical protein
MHSTGKARTCSSCQPGYRCPPGSQSPTPTATKCAVGGYCHQPSVFSFCPAGTYGVKEAGVSEADACVSCPPGYYCTQGSVQPLSSCPKGHYCPQGTRYASEHMCPGGTFLDATGATQSSDCQACLAGFYCPPGSPASDKVCPSGMWCPVGTASFDQYPCPLGTFSGRVTGLVASTQCHDCLAGSCVVFASTSA